MGTWGSEVGDDDEFQDVVLAFDERLKQTRSVTEATIQVREVYADELANPYEAATVVFALLNQQWTYGRVDPDLIELASADGFGLENWGNAAPKDIQARRESIREFLGRVSVPREAPLPIVSSKTAHLPPAYSPGDCLSVRIEGEQFTAAYVLDAKQDETRGGCNLIVSLNILTDQPPDLAVFTRANWLQWPNGAYDCAWFTPKALGRIVEGHRQIVPLLEVIGTVPVPTDKDWSDRTYSPWNHIGLQVLDRRTNDGVPTNTP